MQGLALLFGPQKKRLLVSFVFLFVFVCVYVWRGALKESSPSGPSYERNNFVATCNTRALVALGQLAFVILRCRTDQSSRSFLPAVEHLWYLLPSGVFSGGTLKLSWKHCELVPTEGLALFFLFISVPYSLLGIMVLWSFWCMEYIFFLVLWARYF